jgi:hypothetical protein
MGTSPVLIGALGNGGRLNDLDSQHYSAAVHGSATNQQC